MIEPEYGPSPREIVRQQVDLYERSGGTDGLLSYKNKLPIVVLTTTGARTGLLRKTPLMRVERAGRYLAVASMGGSDHHPQWVHNLRAEPVATLQDGPRTFRMSCVELVGPQRGQWWDAAVETYPLYAEYQQATRRVIPLFLLTPSVGMPPATTGADGVGR